MSPFRHPLSSTHTFLTLLATAHSTRWPKHSRFAVFLLCTSVVLCVAQFAVILALAAQLLHLRDTASCYISIPGGKWVLEERGYPVTFQRVDGSGKYGVGRVVGKGGIVYIAIVTSMVIIALLTALVCMHFRKAGIQNRTGLFWGFIALCLLSIITLQDTWLGPDLHNNHTAPACLQPHTVYAVLQRLRTARLSLEVSSEVLSSLGALCTALYLALAISACQQNHKDNLLPPATRLDNLSARGPPHGKPETPDNTLSVSISVPRKIHTTATRSQGHDPRLDTTPASASSHYTRKNPSSSVDGTSASIYRGCALASSGQARYARIVDDEADLGKEVDGWTPLSRDGNEEERRRKDSKNP